MKLLKKAKRVHQISEDFAYLSYFENTSLDLLVWSNYKVYSDSQKHESSCFLTLLLFRIFPLELQKIYFHLFMSVFEEL